MADPGPHWSPSWAYMRPGSRKWHLEAHLPVHRELGLLGFSRCLCSSRRTVLGWVPPATEGFDELDAGGHVGIHGLRQHPRALMSWMLAAMWEFTACARDSWLARSVRS